MMIHTKLHMTDLYAANREGNGDRPGAVYLETEQRGSRSSDRAFKVSLSAEPDERHRRARNFRQDEDRDYYTRELIIAAATYDDWGRFFAAVYRMDPTAKIGHYTGLEDMQQQVRESVTRLGKTTGHREHDAAGCYCGATS